MKAWFSLSSFGYSGLADVISKGLFAILFSSFNYFCRPENNDAFDINSILTVLIQPFSFSTLCSTEQMQNYAAVAVTCIQNGILVEIILQF